MGDTIVVKRDVLSGLLKQGAANMRATARKLDQTLKERDTLLKFAQAVEILPALEKSAAVRFPENLSFAEKALRLSKKSSAELEKLAYMAKHLPDAAPEMAKVADGNKGVPTSGALGELTQRLIGITG